MMQTLPVENTGSGGARMNQSMMASQKTGEDHELPNSVDAQARNASYNETFDSS